MEENLNNDDIDELNEHTIQKYNRIFKYFLRIKEQSIFHPS
jgi:hypothetical protein